MKVPLLLLMAVVIVMASAQQQRQPQQRRPQQVQQRRPQQPRQGRQQFRPANNRRPNNNNQFRPANNRRPNNNVRRPVNNNRPINNNNRPINNNRPVSNNRPRPSTFAVGNNNNNFRATPAKARDSSGTDVYPGCNGTVCLPEANLCAVRKQKGGHFTFGRKSYWVSWASNEPTLRNARWNWFTGRNYCRKMCMDMVSFETEQEQNFVTDLMRSSNIKDVHTAGRLCDAEVEGCATQPRFQPLHINGWFWASTLHMMPPTNQASTPNRPNNWSNTGPKGAKQPDGTLKSTGFGNEACMALLDNKFNDGFKWHDESCANRRVLICEDLPTPNINFVRNQNPGIQIP